MAQIADQTNAHDCCNNLVEKIREIVRSNGIKDTMSEIIIKDAGLQGKGFASVTQCVAVIFENPERKPLNLFVKRQTDNPSHTQYLEDIKAFEKEATFLIDYVAAAEEMCKSKGHEGFIDFYPKCYYGDEKLTVLENLMEKGCNLLNEEDRHDLDAAKATVKTLAKHHAISHVMINEMEDPHKFFQRFPNLDHEAIKSPVFYEIMKSTFTSAINSNVKILEKHDIKGAKEAAATLKCLLENPMAAILNCLNKESNFLVLGHGDFKNNNMMFRINKETKEILHQVIIDFQITRYNSPGIDLGYYFLLSVEPTVRKNHLHELLNVYTETLNSVTDQFGHPTNLTSNDIFLEYRKKIDYGFLFAIVLAVGPGMSVFEDKDMDISKIEMSEFGVIMDRLINKWLDENPEKGAQTAEELVKFVGEYNELIR